MIKKTRCVEYLDRVKSINKHNISFVNAAKQCPSVAVLSCSSDGLQKITAEYEEKEESLREEIDLM